MLFASADLRIPLSEFDLSYARSSGPGGQNVNKVNSKAVLRWNVLKSPNLPIGIRARLIQLLGSRLTGDGELIITSDRFRDQVRNREDCFEKLGDLLRAAAEVPKPRKKSKPSKSSKRRLKEAKSRHSQKKQLRRAPRGAD